MAMKQVYTNRIYYNGVGNGNNGRGELITGKTPEEIRKQYNSMLKTWKKDPTCPKPNILTTYHEQPDGKGKKVESVVALGDNKYVDKKKLTEKELAEIKANNVARIVQPRFNAVLDKIDLLIAAAKNPLVTLEADQAEKIMSHIMNKLKDAEQALFQVKKEKGSKKNTVAL